MVVLVFVFGALLAVLMQLTFFEQAMSRLNADGMAIFLTPCHPMKYAGLCVTVWSAMLAILSRVRANFELCVGKLDFSYAVVARRRRRRGEDSQESVVNGDDTDTWKGAFLQPLSTLDLFQWLDDNPAANDRGLVWGPRLAASFSISHLNGTQHQLTLVVEENERLNDALIESLRQYDESILSEAVEAYSMPFRRVDMRIYEPFLEGSAALVNPVGRTLLLQWLIASHSYTTYLEIGCDTDANYAVINPLVSSSACVDPRTGGTHRMTSDEFFALDHDISSGPKHWDLIFIDGLHEAHQVLRDVENALLRMSPGGTIVLHDCNPNIEALEDANWNGDVWKAVAQLRTRLELDIAVGDFDQGCGVIKRRSNTSPLHGKWTIDDVTYAQLANQRVEILRLLTLPDLLAWEANAGTASANRGAEEPFPSSPLDHGQPLGAQNVPDFFLLYRQYEAENGKLLPHLQKRASYFSVYDEQFSRHRSREKVTLVESGVQSGGGVIFWRWYFGPSLTYIGIDSNPSAQQFAAPWAEIVTGDVEDPAFWKQFTMTHERPDIFLHAGANTVSQLQAAFDGAFAWIAPGGVFVSEDNRDDSAAALSRWAEQLHGTRNGEDGPARLETQVKSVHAYKGIVVMKKHSKLNTHPVEIKGGSYTVPHFDAATQNWEAYDWCSLVYPFGFCSEHSPADDLENSEEF
jgi:hypothetical protein